jgi:hypothetical protein
VDESGESVASVDAIRRVGANGVEVSFWRRRMQETFDATLWEGDCVSFVHAHG